MSDGKIDVSDAASFHKGGPGCTEFCNEHGWTIPPGTTCPRCPGGEFMKKHEDLPISDEPTTMPVKTERLRRMRLLLVMAAERLQRQTLDTDQFTLDLERAAGLSPVRPLGREPFDALSTERLRENRRLLAEAHKQDAESRAALIERLTRILEDKPLQPYYTAMKDWERWHLEQRHENCGVCDELKAKNQRVAMCAEHGWTIPEGTTCPRCPGGELYNVPPIENKAKKTDEYYVAQARRYGELLVQGGVRQCPDPTCWCCGFGHRIDGQPWDAKDREAIEATIGLAVEDKERHARICEAASRVASAECGCGGPPNHVPGGIWCRK